MIKPAIVWMLDDQSGSILDDWDRDFSPEEKLFIRVAHDWETVRDHIKDYNQTSTVGELQKIGIGQEEEGTHVQLILVAYGMGKDAFKGWEETQRIISQLAKEVVRIEQQKILLANHQNHLLEDRNICTGVLKETPWLISSRNSRFQTLDSPGLVALFQRLLRALVLTDRPIHHEAESPLGRFFEPPSGEGSVRLLGTPPVSLDHIIEEVAHDCASAVAFRVKSKGVKATGQNGGVLSRVPELVNQVGRGEISNEQMQKRLLGKQGLAGLSAEELLDGGKRVSSDLNKRISTAVKNWKQPRSKVSHHVKLGFWKRVLRLLGFYKEELPPFAGSIMDNALSKDILEAEMADTRDLLQGMDVFFSEINEWMFRNDHRETIFLPPKRLGTWADTLRELLVEELSKATSQSTADFCSDELISRFSNFVCEEFDSNLIADLVEGKWSQTHPVTHNLKLMVEGTSWPFSGCVRQGHSIPYGAGICEKGGPALSRQDFTQVSFWNSPRADLLRASHPIPTSDLRW